MKTKLLAILACLALFSMLLLGSCGDSGSTDGSETPGGENPGEGENPGGDEGPAENVTENGLSYVLSGDKYTVCGYDKVSPDVVIPDTVNGVKVTGINYEVFYDCVTLTSVKLGANVTDIGCYHGCESLKSFELGAAVRTIPDSSFEGCRSLDQIVLPEGITSIGVRAFEYCTSLKSIEIPSSVTSMGIETFIHCENLERVTFREGSVIEELPASAFSYCNKLTSVVIPDSVTKIGSSFAYCPSLTSVTLGSGVTEIGASAFSDCFRLVEIYNFSGIELEKGSDANGYIAKYALSIYNVKDTPSKLTTDENGFIIYTESPVTSYLIGYVGTATDVTVPEGVKMLRDYAFYGCDTLTSITLGKDVNEIGKEVFAGCTALTAINVNEENDNFSSEEGVLFNVNKTKLIKYPIAKSASSYKVPTPVTEIGEKAFLGCEKLEGVILDINVKVIGKNAFEKCINLRSFDTREGVKTIRQQVFYDCFGLTSVTIGENVEELEGVVFNNCYRLVEIYNLSDLTFEIGKTSNGQIAFNARVIHTSREVNSSLSTDENGFVILKDGENKVVVDYVGEGGDIVIPAGVSEINPYAFYQNDNIKNVTVSRDVYRIGRYAFYAMDLLEGVTLEEKSGWWRSNIADATSGNEITAEQIADAQATATALAKTYFSAFWNREKES